MAITTRTQLIEQLALVGITGLARAGDLDVIFEGGSGGDVTVDTLTGAGTAGKAVMKAADGATARTAIGAGTSNVVVGTGATQAKAVNYTPTSAEVSNALKAKASIASLSKVAAESAFDQATAIALANESKLAINAIIDALKL